MSQSLKDIAEQRLLEIRERSIGAEQARNTPEGETGVPPFHPYRGGTAEQSILQALAERPLTSLQLFEAIAEGQDTTPAAQRLIDDALDALHAEGRVLLSLPGGRWHVRTAP